MDLSLIAMALLYLTSGIFHFISPRFFIKIMPPYIPFHKEIVYISGAFEIVFSIMLFFDQWRSTAALLIILLLVAVFPANIQMSINFWKKKNPYLWITILRLPLQLLLIWWAWLYV